MLSQVYSAVPNDVITAARWNNEFGNIYSNGTQLAFPVTVAVSFAGFTITLDNAGVSTLNSSAATGLILTPGSKTGTPGVAGSGLVVAAQTFTDSATAGSGTAAIYSGSSFARPTVAAVNTSVTVTDAATLYVANAPLAGTNVTLTNPWAIWVDAGNVRFDAALTVSGGLTGTVALGKHIEGLICANNAADATNDVDISVGSATSTHATPASRVVLYLNTALTKQLDASWVTGTNQGGLSSSITISDTNYHVFIIRVAGVDDIGFDTSLVAANLIADHGATHFRRIGWIKRVGGTIVAFHGYELSGGGLRFLWDSPTLDADLAATLTTSERTDAAKVPLDYSVEAILNVSGEDAAASSCFYMYCPDLADTAPSATAAPLSTQKAQVANVEIIAMVRVQTDASGLIAARANVATFDDYSFATVGFNWSRR